MSDFLSFQDLLDDYSEQVFVGRTEQLRLFEDAITSERQPFLILNIYGQGGVGKSTLLEQYSRRAENLEVLISQTNEDQTSIVDVLRRFANQLEERGASCEAFSSHYKKYQELKGQIEADPQAPTGFLNFAVRSVTKIGLRSVRLVPVAGNVTGVFLDDSAIDTLADQAGSFASYVSQKYTKRDDRDLLLETDRQLTGYFLEDINNHMRTKRLVLVLDTYEKTSKFLDDWLRDLLRGEFGKFRGNILFVIAGRTSLLNTDQDWTRYGKATQLLEVNRFTVDEASKYLQRSGVSDPEQAEDLIELSGRLPVLLALLVSAPHGAPAQVYSSAVERFLQGTASDQRESALVACVPRFFNQDILALILNPETAGPTFEWLSRTPFVQASVLGWAYHPVVRSMMLGYYQTRSADTCRATHGKLANYYMTQSQKIDLPEDRRPENPSWRILEMERLYHTLSNSVQDGLRQVLSAFLDDRSLGDYHQLSGYAELLDQVGEETDEEVLTHWGNNLAYLSIPVEGMDPNQLKLSSTAATALCDYGSLESQQQASAYALRAEVLLEAKDSRQALDDINKAIKLQPENGTYYRQRSWVKTALMEYLLDDMPSIFEDIHRAIALQPDEAINHAYSFVYHYFFSKDYHAAVVDMDHLIELDPKAENYNMRGILYLDEIEDYPAALADFDRAIELEPDKPDYAYHINRGRAHKNQGKLYLALDDYNLVIDKTGGSSDVFVKRGEVYRDMDDLDAADRDYRKALELDPDNAEAYALRGSFLGDRYEQLAELDRAIELNPDDMRFWGWRSLVHSVQGNPELALQDLDRAIDLRPEVAMNYYMRGRTHLQLGNEEQALFDLSEALERDPDDEKTYYWRARTQGRLGNWAEARDDFERAIELNPDQAEYHAGLAEAFLRLENLEASIEGAHQALKLDPESILAYQCRGNAYHFLGEFQNALDDYQAALDLEPKNHLIYFYRSVSYIQLEKYRLALEDVERAIHIQPEIDDYYGNCGLIKLYLKDFDGAQSNLIKALELNPNNQSAMYNLACVSSLRGDVETACDWLRNAIELDPSYRSNASEDSDFDPIRESAEFQAILNA